MNDLAPNSISASNLTRCKQRTRAGRRCQLRVLDSHSGLCFRHSSLRAPQIEAADFSADLLGEAREFTSASDINKFLSRLLVLLTQDRIATKRAAVLTYICAQLVRTLREIDIENRPESDFDSDIPQTLIVDLQRPVSTPAQIGTVAGARNADLQSA